MQGVDRDEWLENRFAIAAVLSRKVAVRSIGETGLTKHPRHIARPVAADVKRV